MFNRVSSSIVRRTGNHVLASIPVSLVLTSSRYLGSGEDIPQVVAIGPQYGTVSVLGIEGISVTGASGHSESGPDSFISEVYEGLNYPPVFQALGVPQYLEVKLNADR